MINPRQIGIPYQESPVSDLWEFLMQPIVGYPPRLRNDQTFTLNVAAQSVLISKTVLSNPFNLTNYVTPQLEDPNIFTGLPNNFWKNYGRIVLAQTTQNLSSNSLNFYSDTFGRSLNVAKIRGSNGRSVFAFTVTSATQRTAIAASGAENLKLVFATYSGTGFSSCTLPSGTYFVSFPEVYPLYLALLALSAKDLPSQNIDLLDALNEIKDTVGWFPSLNSNLEVALSRLPTIPTSKISGLNSVATTGSYTDLSNKPTTSTIIEGANLYYTDARADNRIAIKKGTSNGLASLDADGKIFSSQLPILAITETFVVNTQAAMLALSAQTGDVVVRGDLKKSFILKEEPASILANWQELLTPTDSVLSVNGQAGAVVLTTSNISEGSNLYHTTNRVTSVIAAQKGVPAGIAPLDANTLINVSYLPNLSATKITSGTFDLARIPTIPNTQISGLGTASTRNVVSSGNATSAEVVLGSDTRLSDSRMPTGNAGGDLTGTYPNPSIPLNTVTFGKLQDINSYTLIGRVASGVGDAEQINISSDFYIDESYLFIDEAKLFHNTLNGYEPNRHVDHSTISINPGVGLTGGGSLTASRTIALANTGVVAGTYPKLTVNSQGQATVGSSLVIADIPSLGVGNGIASLDANALVPLAQLPDLSAAKITSGTLDPSRLPPSGVVAGFYDLPNLTVDDLGRIQTIASSKEEGTFLPGLKGTGVAGTFTYSTRVGSYQKLGNRVSFSFHLGISVAPSTAPTGNIRLTGLPYTGGNLYKGTLDFGYLQGANNTMRGYVLINTTEVILVKTGSTLCVPGDFTFTGCTIIGSGQYFLT